MLLKCNYLFYSLLFSFSILLDDGWQLKKQEHEISVYIRDAEGSSFKELRATTQLKTSLSSIISVLNDWGSYPEWVYKCGESKTLNKISDTDIIHYQTITTPWPVDNRDFVVHVQLSQNPTTKIVIQKSTCIPDYIARKKGFVRITELKSSWTLTPMKNGMVNIDFQLLVNPGGNIPAWLVNMAVVDGPYETMHHLKQRVTNEKYQKASFSFIKE